VELPLTHLDAMDRALRDIRLRSNPRPSWIRVQRGLRDAERAMGLSREVAQLVEARLSEAESPGENSIIELGEGDSEEARYTFYGTPGVFEASLLVEAACLAAGAPSRAGAAVRERLAGLSGELEFEVFSAPTCLFCLPVSRWALQFAAVAAAGRAVVTFVAAWPDRANRWRVVNTPTCRLNDFLAPPGLGDSEDTMRQLVELALGGPDRAARAS
jgi:alkyl hydroperoxide reductase subunit AhpF